MRYFALVIGALALSACVHLPNVYLIDRHTVMEAEASGEWPELEQRFNQSTPAKGPADLAEEPLDRRKEQAFRVLNGEFPAQAPAEANKQ